MRRCQPAITPVSFVAALVALNGMIDAATIPALREQHGAWQLIVDDKPFLMRGGEFSNNVYESPKDIPYLEMMLDAYVNNPG